jgi:stearoyl-CoA desaturase (delta-9 desaturase)
MIGEDNPIVIKYLIKPNYVWMTVMQVLLPIYLFLAIGSEWYWWVLSFIFYFLYLCIGNNIGMHRYYCHKYFVMSKPVEYFVAWCATMACLGSPLSYVSIHNIHHRYNDTDQDPHGKNRGWKSVLYCFHRHIYPKDMIFTKNLTSLMREYHLLHDYYWPIVFVNAFVLYLISWKVLLFCWLIPASLTLWAVALVLLLQHDKNGPSNTRSYMWFSFGETWHGNHHEDASLIDHAKGNGVDWTYELCKILSKSKK